MISPTLPESHKTLLVTLSKKHAAELKGVDLGNIYVRAAKLLNTGATPESGYLSNVTTTDTTKTATVLDQSTGFYIQLTQVSPVKTIMNVGRKYAMESDAPHISSTTQVIY